MENDAIVRAMQSTARVPRPAAWSAIRARAAEVGFGMQSDVQTGALLRTLAASRPAPRVLELGTGLGLATCWLLDGMDGRGRLVTVDHDPALTAFAAQTLGADPRLTVVTADGADLVRRQPPASFDLIFADTWPGKYSLLDETIALLAPHGLYVVDDMLPQPNWPDGHAAKARALLDTLEGRADLFVSVLSWSTGLVCAAKRPA